MSDLPSLSHLSFQRILACDAVFTKLVDSHLYPRLQPASSNPSSSPKSPFLQSPPIEPDSHSHQGLTKSSLWPVSVLYGLTLVLTVPYSGPQFVLTLSSLELTLILTGPDSGPHRAMALVLTAADFVA